MEVSLKPLGKRILVQPEVVKEEKVGGLYIPDNAKEEKKSSSGKVIKLGTADKSKFDMNVGDTVFFKKYSPEEIKINDEIYLVVEVDDVIAIK